MIGIERQASIVKGTAKDPRGDRAADLPSRQRPVGGDRLETLFDAVDTPDATSARRGIGAVLGARYDGELVVPLRTHRPTLVANFVETIDGVVAMDPSGATGGGEVSGFNPADRFVMAVLRTVADAVLVGAGTVRASDGGAWTAQRLRPDLADAIARAREALGIAPQPTTMVVTASGRLDPRHPAFGDPSVPIVIAAAHDVVDRLLRVAWPAHVRVEPLPADVGLGAGVVEVARRLGARLVLSEAGPHVTAELLADRVLDELFVTISPQLAGRAARADRLALVEGRALWPTDPRWLHLTSIRRGGDHLFLRYRLEDPER